MRIRWLNVFAVAAAAAAATLVVSANWETGKSTRMLKVSSGPAVISRLGFDERRPASAPESTAAPQGAGASRGVSAPLGMPDAGHKPKARP